AVRSWGRPHRVSNALLRLCEPPASKYISERRSIFRIKTNPMRTFFAALLSLLTLSVMAQLQPVNPGVYKWSDLKVNTREGRESRQIMEGVSPHLEYLEIHATTQFKGAKPGTAHANDDIEECIIVKEGTLRATVDDRTTILGPGGVILLMPRQMHSIENIGDGNLTYYVMRYRSRKPMALQRGEGAGGTHVLNADSLAFKP